MHLAFQLACSICFSAHERENAVRSGSLPRLQVEFRRFEYISKNFLHRSRINIEYKRMQTHLLQTMIIVPKLTHDAEYCRRLSVFLCKFGFD
jgi:hypothetical protein